jgi:formylglycine-generating enzyme required for sulfatase activity
MGSPTGEVGRSADETQHQVTLTGFYMGKHPVTQAQYEAVMETNPSSFTTLVSPEISTASRPVEFVTWYDAVEFCNKLSEREGLTPVYTMTGRTPASGYPITDATVTADWSTDGYRLPTEAQWEYACRAGTTTMYNTGATIGDSTGWYTVNSDDRTHSVGEKPANAFGLYDMHGNVYEWCWDRYNLNYYSSSPAQDPTGPDSGGGRVRRGGSWDDSSQFLRSAFRGFTDPGIRRFYIGFRVVRPIATGGGNQTLEIEMVQVQGGTFTMGSPTNEPDRYNDETQHPVTLTGFRMGKYPVTQEQYEAVMENNPSVFMIPVAPETSTASRPVEFVTWYDAVEFCNKLSEQEGLTPVYNITGRTPATGYPITGATVTPDWSASGYRLPTEAQWEYACRAGTITAYNTGDTISDDTGWYDSNSGLRTHTVGEKPANAWNLYDMHGNVYEWCWDWYDAGYYLSSSAQDPTGPDSGYTRVARGGTWINSGRYLRSAYRYDYDPDDRGGGIGFRVVLPF